MLIAVLTTALLFSLLTSPVAAVDSGEPQSSVQSDENVLSATERRNSPAIVETVHGFPPPAVTRPLLPPARSLALENRSLGQRPGALFGLRIDGTMTTTYETDTPQAVQNVIDSAVAAWDQALSLSPAAPVEISVRWMDLGPRLLGQAGTEGEYRNAEKFPTDRWYPAALANQLANVDVNGADTPEILVELNSGLGEDWYIGTDKKPGFGQIDLYSVVLHEIAHGLGFLGSAVASRDGTVSLDTGSPSIYDDFVVTNDGDAVIDLEAEAGIAALKSQALKFDVGFGRLMPVHAPSRFVNGSSYSHFDESIGSDEPGAMMTPALRNGESQREIDAAVLGVLDQIGWSLDVGLLEPRIDEVQVRSGGLEVAWTEDWTIPAAFGEEVVLSATPQASSGQAPAAVERTVEAGRAASTQVRGLQNGTSYELQLTAARDGVSPGTGVRTTFLLPANPNAVPELSVTRGQAEVSVSWGQPVSSGEPIDSFEVNYRAATDRQWQTARVSSSATSWARALPPGRYWFRVRGINRIGDGLWTESDLVGLADGVVRPMPLDGQLARLYRAYFGRDADGEGLDYWRRIRAQSIPLASVSDEFSRSEEFRATYGPLDERQFVDRLYWNVLGRSPDAEGYEYWLGLLEDGVTRGTVVLWFSESEEFIRVTGTTPSQTSIAGSVERAHLGLLRRAPTATELATLISQRETSSLSSVAADIIASDEFRSVWETVEGPDLLEIIGRSMHVDRIESASMVSRLDRGTPLVDLLLELTESPRFIVVTGTVP